MLERITLVHILAFYRNTPGPTGHVISLHGLLLEESGPWQKVNLFSSLVFQTCYSRMFAPVLLMEKHGI